MRTAGLILSFILLMNVGPFGFVFADGLISKDEIIEKLKAKPEKKIKFGRRSATPPTQQLAFSNILFKSGSVEFSNQETVKQVKDIIDAFGADELKNGSYIIEGHTDDIGSNDYNTGLSLKRADRIKKMICSSNPGLLNSIQAVGKGETEPIADNTTDQGRQKNRRVVIERVSSTPSSTATKSTAASTKSTTTTNSTASKSTASTDNGTTNQEKMIY